MSDHLARALADHPGRSDVLERETAAGRDLFGTLQTLQGRHGRVHDVDRVVGAERLRQHVVDTRALQHGTHRATGDDAGTGGSRAEQDHTGGFLTRDRVGNGATDARNAEEVLLRFLDALGDRRGNFLGLAVADADLTVTVTDDDEGGEAEATTTLDDLGDAVDRHDLLEVRGLVLAGPATAAVAPVPAATATVIAVVAALPAGSALSAAELPCTSRHQAFLPLTSFCIVRTPTPPHGRRRRARRCGRGRRCPHGRTPQPRSRRSWPARRRVPRPSRPWPSCRRRTTGCPPRGWTPTPACGRRGRR